VARQFPRALDLLSETFLEVGLLQPFPSTSTERPLRLVKRAGKAKTLQLTVTEENKLMAIIKYIIANKLPGNVALSGCWKCYSGFRSEENCAGAL
jgi:hypothetical protein